jgi:hypothetical protein
MKDKTRLPADQRPALLEFTPVPRQQRRHDGWTPERQRLFIAALAETGSVTAAAQAVNMGFTTAYRLYHHPDGASLRAAWDHAISLGVQRLHDVAIERAINGVAVPVFYRGEQVSERRTYNENLLVHMLRFHNGGYAASPVGRRSRAAIERAAAENCPVCRDRREAEEKAATAEEALAFAAELLERYLIKVEAERRHRLAGEIVAADFMLRQLTWIEYVLDALGEGERVLTWWREHGTEPMARPEPSPIAALLADLRVEAWAEAGDPPRPAPVLLDGPRGVKGGPTIMERHAAQKEACQRIAAAQAMWEAAAREDTWATWRARGIG